MTVRPARRAGRLALLSLAALAGILAGPAPSVPWSAVAVETVAAGDLPAIRAASALRLLVTAPEHLQRAGDLKREELALAVGFAQKLGLRAVPVMVSDRRQLIPALRAGHGDVIVGSLAVTPERAEAIAFT